jgi:hypothetical protein
MPVEYLARLDKKRERRVLCGRLVNGHRVCDGELARVVDYPWNPANMTGSVTGTRDRHFPRIVCFAPGWVPSTDDAELWRPNPRTMRRERQGKSGSFSCAPVPEKTTVKARLWGLGPRNLPACAKCPDCDVTNVLDPEILRVCRYVPNGFPTGIIPRWMANHHGGNFPGLFPCPYELE